MELSIIIVNYNTANFLKKCLDSINSKKNWEIIVIDNNSKDNSVEIVEKEYPHVKLIKNDINLGYATAINQGIREATGKYILVLNPDIEIINDAIDKMIEFMSKNDTCACVGPKLLDLNKNTQPSAYKFPNILWLPIHLLRIKYLLSKLGVKFTIGTSKVTNVDWVLGCCMLIKREAIDKIGLFDENFFLYFEEIDWQRRVRQKGYKIWYYPAAEVIHYLEQSSKKEEMRCFFERYRSLFYYYKKYYGTLGLIYSKLLTFIIFSIVYIFKFNSRDKIKYHNVLKYIINRSFRNIAKNLNCPNIVK